MNTFFECLTENSFSLRHWAFDCIDDNDCTVDCSHCTSNISTEVDVTWGINHVDEVFLTVDFVNHRNVGGVDSNSTCLFFLVGVSPACLSCKFLREHSCSREKVVRKGSLSVVNVCYDTDVSNVLSIVHQHINTLNHLLSA